MASDKDIEGWLNDHTGSVQAPSPSAKAPNDADIEGWLNDKTGGQLSLGQTVSTLAPALFGDGGAAETPWSRLSNLFPKIAAAGAEAIGKAAVNPTVNSISQHLIGLSPDTANASGIPAALAMLPTALAPHAVALAGAGSEAVAGANRVGEIVNAGSRIGAAEKAAGVITKAADKYPTSGNVGEVLNTLESQLKNGTLTDPQTLQQANDIINYVWKNPNLVGKTPAITAQSARVSSMVKDALNAVIPGRAAAATDYGTLMKLVNAANMAKQGVKYAAVGAGSLSALGVLRKYLTGH